ncbi:hypothetical protein ACNOYE_29635 [Nannocystaceae bacterium ST9]
MTKTTLLRMPIGILLMMSCALPSSGCVDDATTDSIEADFDQEFEPGDEVLAPDGPEAEPVQGEQGGKSVPTDSLPVVESQSTFVQLLDAPTALGENVALHVELPAPHNPALADSKIRLIGDPSNPLVLVRSDALVELGQLAESPGKQFFTVFLTLDEAEIEKRVAAEAKFGKAEKLADKRIVFKGRTPVAVTSGVEFDTNEFFEGKPTKLGPCPIMPLSELARWEESLMITDPVVVQDNVRTWDSCTGSGDPDGAWTFHHLMTEMAAGAVPAMSVQDFTVEWLETWLNTQVVNGDTIPARMQMFNRVIKPWADASGAVASTVIGKGGHVNVKIDGVLDWKSSPFRLSAIVNRIDLGKDAKGGGGYGGGIVSVPQTAGELRFVFGVQDLNTCNVMRFSVIFEYGVPLEGCQQVKDWAVAWTELNDPTIFPRFSPSWLTRLEKLTESVVVFGAAPSKGNKNAINQVRTNENALNPQWEFREFTLTKEDPTTTPNDTPADGPLRPHSVAMTIDDTAFSEFSDPFVDGYLFSDVLPTVGAPAVLPNDCTSSYEVPLEHLGTPFRGGNSFTAPVFHWENTINPAINAELCARHELSLNNCNGCHFDDTATFFFHVDPQPMPAGLSNFLTGAGGLWSVPDPQFPGAVTWTFADLDRRFNRLYAIACAECGEKAGIDPKIIDVIKDLGGVLPIDPIGPVADDVEIGPITDIDVVAQILEARASLGVSELDEDVEIGGFIRPAQNFVH